MNRILSYLSIVCTTALACCTRTPDERLYMVENNGLYGYTSKSRDTIIPCLYPVAYTDTINHIGFVADANGEIVCLDKKGNKLFNVFKYDNGPDYPREGLFRIVDKHGAIGFADTLGNIIIQPCYKFASPFKDGKAKVTHEGQAINHGEHYVWESPSWTYIDNPRKKVGRQ